MSEIYNGPKQEVCRTREIYGVNCFGWIHPGDIPRSLNTDEAIKFIKSGNKPSATTLDSMLSTYYMNEMNVDLNFYGLMIEKGFANQPNILVMADFSSGYAANQLQNEIAQDKYLLAGGMVLSATAGYKLVGRYMSRRQFLKALGFVAGAGAAFGISSGGFNFMVEQQAEAVNNCKMNIGSKAVNALIKPNDIDVAGRNAIVLKKQMDMVRDGYYKDIEVAENKAVFGVTHFMPREVEETMRIIKRPKDYVDRIIKRDADLYASQGKSAMEATPLLAGLKFNIGTAMAAWVEMKDGVLSFHNVSPTGPYFDDEIFDFRTFGMTSDQVYRRVAGEVLDQYLAIV